MPLIGKGCLRHSLVAVLLIAVSAALVVRTEAGAPGDADKLRRERAARASRTLRQGHFAFTLAGGDHAARCVSVLSWSRPLVATNEEGEQGKAIKSVAAQ